MESVVEIATSPNPRMANRERLINCVLEAARFNVLTFDPPPGEDMTGIRGQVGISGELEAHITQIAKMDKNIRTFLHSFEEKFTEASDIVEYVAFRGLLCTIWANLYHGLRYVFDDCNKQGKDWYRPFVVAVYGWQEAEYRGLLGMPSSIRGHDDTDKKWKALYLSLFVDSVDSGVQFPDLDWSDKLIKIEKGDRDWRKQSWLDV